MLQGWWWEPSTIFWIWSEVASFFWCTCSTWTIICICREVMERLFQLYLIQSIFYMYVCSQVTRLFNYILRISGWTESVFQEKDLLLFILLFILLWEGVKRWCHEPKVLNLKEIRFKRAEECVCEIFLDSDWWLPFVIWVLVGDCSLLFGLWLVTARRHFYSDWWPLIVIWIVLILLYLYYLKKQEYPFRSIFLNIFYQWHIERN